MPKLKPLNKKNLGLLGTIFGSLLIGLPATSISSASAQTTRGVLNPCPRIYYEDPYNSRVMVPEGCPPNDITRITLNQQPSDVVAGERAQPLPGANQTPDRIVPADAPTTPVGSTGAAAVPDQTNPPVQPPLPEERSHAIARVMPMNGTVNVRLKNNTNAIVTYEAVGHTQRRILPGREETVLRSLPTPVTITMVRQDEGLLKVTPVSTKEQGVLEVSLDEEKNLDDNQGTLRIQRDGQVFLN